MYHSKSNTIATGRIISQPEKLTQITALHNKYEDSHIHKAYYDLDTSNTNGKGCNSRGIQDTCPPEVGRGGGGRADATPGGGFEHVAGQDVFPRKGISAATCRQRGVYLTSLMTSAVSIAPSSPDLADDISSGNGAEYT